MRIILAATPQLGHLNPLLSAGRLLRAAGHELLVTSASVYRGQAETIGARFVALPPGADLDMRDLDALYPARKLLPAGLAQLRFDFEQLFIDTIPAQYAGLTAILADFEADLILSDTLFGGTLPLLLGHARRPAIAALGVTFLPCARDDGAPMGLGLAPAAGLAQLAEYGLLAEGAEAGFLAPLQRRVDAILRGLGAAALPLPYADALVLLQDVFLQPAVPGFEYPRRNMPARLHFIGALPPLAGGAMPPAVAAALAAARQHGRRVVLVTQGTVANYDLGRLLQPTLAALAGRDDLLVLATTGGRPLEAIPGGLPPNACAAAFLPYDQLMPEIDLLVTNGGYGTVTHALSAGIPVISAGSTEDKNEIGARIAWSGAGIDLRSDSPDAAQLGRAVDAVLGQDSYRRCAAALAHEFAARDAARALPSLLEAAVRKHCHERHQTDLKTGETC